MTPAPRSLAPLALALGLLLAPAALAQDITYVNFDPVVGAGLQTNGARADLSTTAPQEQRRAVSEPVATKLTELMIRAEQFTQQNGAIPGVQIASKTGTAEHGTDPRNTPPHAWYIAFAPAQNPKVAVAVVVENGGNRLAATGGALAAPIGRAAIAAALQGAP